MRRLLIACLVCAALILSWGTQVEAYPYYAQSAYDTPREATGKIVCANCHLAQKPIQVELPQSVTPGQVFDATVEIPYDLSTQQILGDGELGGLNVGAVLILPEGFRLASEDEMTEEQLEAYEQTFIQPYSDESENILLVGPLPGNEYQEIEFPIKAPEATDGVPFMKYYVYAGGNRGRGQLNPDGGMSNNNVFTAPVAGTIETVLLIEDPYEDEIPVEVEDLVDVDEILYNDTRIVTFNTEEGLQGMIIPPGPELIKAAGDRVEVGEALTTNPNVGGFGQKERELVFQDPTRVKWLMAFLGAVLLAQIMLVLKKKQVEQIQAAELLG